MDKQRTHQKNPAAPTHPHPTKTSVKSPVHQEDDLQGAIGNRQMGLLMETHPHFHPSSLNATMVGEMPMLGGMMPVSQGRIQRQPLFGGLSQEMRLENATLALPATGALVQRKLTLGTPGDMYEEEADRVARQVVDKIHSSPFREQNALSEEERIPAGGEAGRVQRQITVRSAGDAGGELSSEWEGELQRAKSGGQPLSPSVKEPMERAFGADFGGVRVHTGAQADMLARSIQAKAFTTGQDVFFRQGAYESGSRGGQELLAHELSHVVQQRQKKESERRKVRSMKNEKNTTLKPNSETRKNPWTKYVSRWGQWVNTILEIVEILNQKAPWGNYALIAGEKTAQIATYVGATIEPITTFSDIYEAFLYKKKKLKNFEKNDNKIERYGWEKALHYMLAIVWMVERLATLAAYIGEFKKDEDQNQNEEEEGNLTKYGTGASFLLTGLAHAFARYIHSRTNQRDASNTNNENSKKSHNNMPQDIYFGYKFLQGCVIICANLIIEKTNETLLWIEWTGTSIAVVAASLEPIYSYKKKKAEINALNYLADNPVNLPIQDNSQSSNQKPEPKTAHNQPNTGQILHNNFMIEGEEFAVNNSMFDQFDPNNNTNANIIQQTPPQDSSIIMNTNQKESSWKKIKEQIKKAKKKAYRYMMEAMKRAKEIRKTFSPVQEP